MMNDNVSESTASPSASYSSQNRTFWNAYSDEYEQLHAPNISGEKALAWGNWRIPEADLQIFGDVKGKDILELGCGAARFSLALALCGARPVGLDISARQLEIARRLMAEAGVTFPLVESDAEQIPLPDASFDFVFSDWGAMTTCQPARVLPEAARLLRPGGILAFSTHTPLTQLSNFWEDADGRQLVHDAFGMKQTLHWKGATDFVLSYPEWIKLFRRTGLNILDLIEVQPPPAAPCPFLTDQQREWANHWPIELIWKVQKEAKGSSH